MPLKLPEQIHQLALSVGIENAKAEDDLKVFYESAFNKYSSLVSSYVARNASFLTNQLVISISHATAPSRNPSSFGLALGGTLALLKKGVDPKVCEALMKDQVAHDNIKKILDHFKSIQGFDIEILRENLIRMSVFGLKPEETEKFNLLSESFSATLLPK